jgi:hypothetical protein
MDDEWTLGGALSDMRSGLANWRNETFGPIRTAVAGWRNRTFGRPMGDVGRQDRYGRDDDDPAAEVRAAMAPVANPAKLAAARPSFNYAQRRPAFNPMAPIGLPREMPFGFNMGGPTGFEGGYDPYQQRRLV